MKPTNLPSVVPARSRDMPKSIVASSFDFTLPFAWLAIAVLWIITPLSYLFVLWHLITLAPSLAAYGPAQQGALRIIDYIILAYCCIEIPFSIYYRYLAHSVQKRRYNPPYSRKFLRSVFKESLENGLNPPDDKDGESMLEELMTYSQRRKEKENGRFYQTRNRKATIPGTPEVELQDLPTLMENYALSKESLFISKAYTPSFIKTPLGPNDPRALDFQSHIRLWFHDIPYDNIRRLDMFDWLSWSLYAQPYEELVAERKQWIADGRPEVFIDGALDNDDEGIEIEGDKLGLVEHCVDLVEARAGKTFPPGRNKDVKVIRLTLDKVKVHSRPFILYAFVWAAQRIIIGNAMAKGFRKYRQGSSNYIMRIPEGWTPDASDTESTQPLMFIHGLGMGMAQYASLLTYIAKAEVLKERPVIIPIQPHISMSFFEKDYLRPPERVQTTKALVEIAEKWGFDKCGLTVLSHSNGTMVHGWLVKAAPELVKRSCFVDPVCFCLWEPFVAHGFLYSTPKTPIEYLMRYFVGRELGIAHTLHRHFDWSSNLLFPSQIPKLTSPYHSAFFLSGRDSVLNSTRIRRYLRHAGVREVGKGENVGEIRGGMKTHHKNSHGESLIGRGRAFHQIMAWIQGELGDLNVQVPDSDDAMSRTASPAPGVSSSTRIVNDSQATFLN